MRKDKILDVLEEIDDKYINEAVQSKEAGMRKVEQAGRSGRKTTVSGRVKWIAAAASIALIVIAASAAVAIHAEATEYNEAMSFFADNDLSVEGLSRAEIKAVYRDIINNRFENEKTAEVIKKNIPGYEISPEEPTAEELAEAWKNRIWIGEKVDSEYTYEMDFVMGPDEEVGSGQTLQKTVVTCFKNGEKLWDVDVLKMWAFKGKILRTSFGTLIWEDYIESHHNHYGKMICVNDDGTIKWEKNYKHGLYETLYAVLENKDGTVVTFSTHYAKEIPEDIAPASTQSYLCICVLDQDGNEVRRVSNEFAGGRVEGVSVCKDGFLAIVSQNGGENAGISALFTIGSDGTIREKNSFGTEEREYIIIDSILFEGKIYISAYSYPKTEGGYGGRDEIGSLLDYMFRGPYKIYGFIVSDRVQDEYDEGLLRLARENYTAELLIFDGDLGEPKTFYSVKGAMGGKLSVNEQGQLTWLSNNVSAVGGSLVTSAWSIMLKYAVYRNVFDTDGKLIVQEDTGTYDLDDR